MLKYIVVIHIGLINTSNAATTKAVVVFKDKQGTAITLEQAWQISAKGETVYRCQPVKATVNKSGTSISFKVVK